jgi:hypothetical protein
MILDPSERASRRKPDPLDAELDALVAREVDALAARKARPGVTRRATDAIADADAASPQRAVQQGDTAAAKVRPHDGNVIGIRRAERNGRADGVLFSAQEDAFIEQSVAFLEKRENADLIIEEIWTRSVLDRHDDLDDTRSDEALSPEQVDAIGPDVLSAEPAPRPNGGGPATTASHTVTAIQSGRGARPEAAGESDTGEASE